MQRDTYVDDCLSGGKISNQTLQIDEEFHLISNKGGFTLKGIKFSWKDLPSTLLTGNKNINVDGLKWSSEGDMISLDVSKLNFVKKKRGKKPNNQMSFGHCVPLLPERLIYT